MLVSFNCPPSSKPSTAAGIPCVWSLVYWSHVCVFQRLLRTKSTLLFQNLFLLFFELRINLSTFGRLVAVILSLKSARTLANHAFSRRRTLEGGTQRVIAYRQSRVFLQLFSLLRLLLWLASTLWKGLAI